MNRLKFEALASSILIYLIIIVTIFSIALYSPSKEKAKNYTVKKSEVIEVSLGSPTPKINHSSKKRDKRKKSESKKEKKHKKPPKKVRNIKPTKTAKATKKTKRPTKKVTKKRDSSTKEIKKVAKSSKPNMSNLFKNIPKNIANDKAEDKPQGKAGKSLKKVNKSSGIENRYFAKIQNTLKGWPAQSNFAGEKVRVELTVYSTGLFNYKILSRSLNPEFNRSLKAYLEQLKKFGFGPHSNPKPYKIIVEFIAKG